MRRASRRRSSASSSTARGPSALTRFDGRREPLAYLDYLTSAPPYHLLDHPRVLVLGAGAGADVLQAIQHGARAVDAVELEPADRRSRPAPVRRLLRASVQCSGVRVHIDEARGFVARHDTRFDLIEVALLDAFGASAAGSTRSRKAISTRSRRSRRTSTALRRGACSRSRAGSVCRRATCSSSFATAVAALERRGVEAPGRQLALVRSWNTVTLLVKNGSIHDDATSRRSGTSAASARSTPTITRASRPPTANRYNVLDASYFHDGALALLGPERAAFVERYKFAIAPATDDRPHFFRFFRWRTLPELLSLKERGGLPLLEWGYPILIATLIQATLASVLLIVLPLRSCRAARDPSRRSRLASSSPPISAAIGFAFMFIEIAFIQKFILFLAHPLYAVAVVLCAFLVFAGLGSRSSPRLRPWAEAAAVPRIALPVAAIARLRVDYLVVLPAVVPAPDAAPRSRADPGRDGADRAARVRDGNAVSARARAARRAAPSR